jgi:hypothetical protein
MDFNELIADFATRHNVDDLTVVDDAAALDIDGITVLLVSNGDLLTISAEVGEPPVEGAAAFANLLLEANMQSDFFFAKASGTDNYIIVRRIALVSIDATSFDLAIEALVNQAETWRRLLADFRPAAKAAATRAESENPSFGSTGFMQV